jgi:hypothetical protein
MEEAAELQALIAAVVDSGGAAAPQHYDRYKAIVGWLCVCVLLLLQPASPHQPPPGT